MRRLLEQPATSTLRPWIIVTGCVALAVSAICSGLLLLESLGALDLPGCGKGSPCAQVTSSKWGKVPGLGLSTAGLGLAYFAGMLVAWVIWRGRVSRMFAMLAVIGGLASLLLTGVMFSKGTLCRYCLAAHMANLAFVALVLRCACDRGCTRDGRDPPSMGMRQVSLAAASIVLISLCVLSFEASQAGKARDRQEVKLQDTLKTLTNKAEAASRRGGHEVHDETQVGESVTESVQIPETSARGFEGRFRLGPDPASIRIVMFTDYQCPDCKKLEEQLKRVLAMNLDLAVSIKLFPLSTVCNPNVTQDMHPDACWAAAAALAAGQLGGRDAFWAMHHWLFERGGSITRESLANQARVIGLDPARVLAIVDDPATMREVRKDIDEGIALGLTQTPMIFLNGVELKGWIAPDALVRAVETIAKARPAPATSASDRPPPAADRYIADWDAAPSREIPSRILNRSTGPSDAPVTIVVVGDYAEPGTIEADASVRALMQGQGARVRYAFAHFPMNQACNSSVPFTKFATSCLSARAAQGALQSGGNDAFWRAHEWLMRRGAGITAADFAEGAGIVQVDADQWIAAMSSATVEQAIQDDARETLALGMASIPAMYINGKLAVNWKVRGESLLPRLVERARGVSAKDD